MEFVFSKGERFVVAFMIGQLAGVNRTDARLVAKVSEHLELDVVQSIPNAELTQEGEFELATLEIDWVLDHINKTFNDQKMPPMSSRFALSLEDKLKDTKEVGE